MDTLMDWAEQDKADSRPSDPIGPGVADSTADGQPTQVARTIAIEHIASEGDAEVSLDREGGKPSGTPNSGTHATATGEQPESSINLFSSLDELFATSDWGDVLRIVNFRPNDIGLVLNENSSWDVAVFNWATGMWRMQGATDFPPLWDSLLSEANETALDLVEQGELISDRACRKLRNHVASSTRASAMRAAKRAPRLAEDRLAPVDRVDVSLLNPVDRHPVFPCRNGVISLVDGTFVDPRDIQKHFLLDMTPSHVSHVPDAVDSDSQGAETMRRFLRYLGCGDEWALPKRLGWQLCGHHHTVDVIAGDLRALNLLARVLRATLGPSGARLFSIGKGAIKPRDLAFGMEQARLCLWSGADTGKKFPVWEANALINHVDPKRQGNLTLLVSNWPDEWETLDHRIASTCGWAWRAEGSLIEQCIDPDALFDDHAEELLLAMLVEGAITSLCEFYATKADTGIGDPSRVAATDYSRDCAEEMRVAGGNAVHRALYTALRYTGDPHDLVTFDDIEAALKAAGAAPIPHHVVGKIIGQMWESAKSSREQIDGTQTRVIRCVAPRTPAAEK